MGSGGTPPKASKSTPPATQQQESPAPPWNATMQGYYPPGAAQAYYPPNAGYIWGQQRMMAPYGPYYPVPYQFPGIASPPGSGNEAGEGKSSQGKKRKTKAKSVEKGSSAQSESEGSSDGSDFEKDGEKKNNELAVAAPDANVAYAAMDYWSGAAGSVQGKRGASSTMTPTGPAEHDIDERELKRQRRKQSNRESARRSRQRKQKECEELMQKVEAFTAENAQLKAQVTQLQEELDQIRAQSASYLEELQKLQQQSDGKNSSSKPKTQKSSPAGIQKQQIPEPVAVG